MREGLDRVVDALRLAAAGLDQLFERKGIKSHMMPNPDGHPWIRVMHPMDEVRFIGITPMSSTKAAQGTTRSIWASSSCLRVFLVLRFSSRLLCFMPVSMP